MTENVSPRATLNCCHFSSEDGSRCREAGPTPGWLPDALAVQQCDPKASIRALLPLTQGSPSSLDRKAGVGLAFVA